MKNISIIIVLFLFTLTVNAQKPKWPKLEDYHSVMAKTFHPAEEGNYKPIVENAGELAMLATALKKSKIPTEYQKPGVKESISALEKESKAIAKMVKKKANEEELKKAIFALHDRFHEVMEKCNH
jgi:hypothetical protein